MWYARKKTETHITFWWLNLKDRNNFKYLGIGGREILKWTLKKYDGRVYNGFIWIKIQAPGTALWLQSWTRGFHKMQGVSWLAKKQLASRGLCCMELVSYLLQFTSWTPVCYKSKSHRRWGWQCSRPSNITDYRCITLQHFLDCQPSRITCCKQWISLPTFKQTYWLDIVKEDVGTCNWRGRTTDWRCEGALYMELLIIASL